MTQLLDVPRHLRAEMTKADPWGLESNPFEHRRYAIMLDMIRSWGRSERGLEIGCAAGAFTQMLSPHCDSLHVVDVMAEAVQRHALENISQSDGAVTHEAMALTGG